MKPRLLIVDDFEEVIRNYSEYFRRAGWDASGVTDGSEALRALDSSFHALILNRNMPGGMSGDAVLREIRKRSDLDKLCIVMLTGSGSLESAVQAFRLGIHDYLEKPQHPRDLHAILVAGIAKKKAQMRLLRVFLCHSSMDKPFVRDLYHRLKGDLVDPWLDEEDLLAGQDWDLEIRAAVRASDVVVVCLSQNATTRAGYLHKEIGYALDVADEQPEGVTFVIPLKLDGCNVPRRLSRWQWIQFDAEGSYERSIRALRSRSRDLGLL